MPLTPEQRAIRATGIGASEIAELVELHPYRGPIDVWLDKTGRAAPRAESDQGALGHHLEAFALAAFSRRSGVRLYRPKTTLRHPRHPHVLASPDALGRTEDLGAEAKIVGWRMAHHWAESTIPDYVRLQAIQNMAVTGRSRWIVVALVGGTDLRTHVVERDLELEEMLAESAETFWADHIAADVPPRPTDPEQRRRYLLTRYPGSEATKVRPTKDPLVAEAVARIRELDAQAKDLEHERAELTDALCEIVGDDRGIEGPWGKLLWYPQEGRANWKEIAEELAGGAIPEDLINRHRGEPSRVARLHEPRKTLLTSGKKGKKTT